jgi:hypothetical protein
MNRRLPSASLVALILALGSAQAAAPAFIRELNLVHFCHTDIGFTDHPLVARELHRRYLDVAALPFNQTPFLNAAQWDILLHWLPDDLWRDLHPTVAIQNDVNGFPRAGARRLLDRGIHRLFMGINDDSGGAPFPRPAAFWWRQPDGRRLFVWLNAHYGSGFEFFEPDEWRRGPVPAAADTRYRPPRAGDILSAEERAVRAAHRICAAKLAQLEARGYTNAILAISITSLWRMDNDPPFPPLAGFVAAWNRLGLQPALRLTTASAAMQRLEDTLGPSAPEYAGEWTDWWANGTASAPREVAASRFAKRTLAAALSPLWGNPTPGTLATANDLYRDLALFDEHTWGSSWSIGLPYLLDTQAQFNEKAALAYRPMARAEWLLGQRTRTRLARQDEGLYVDNPTDAPFSGWIRIPAPALRAAYRSVEDPQAGTRWPLEFERGIAAWGRPRTSEDLTPEDTAATFADNLPDRFARFWLERLPAQSGLRLHLRTNDVPVPAPSNAPNVVTDSSGWPVQVRWNGTPKPLFETGCGDFLAIEVKGFAPRWRAVDIMGERGDAARRDRMRAEALAEVRAEPAGRAERSETSHTLLFSQFLKHPRLAWASRRLELWRSEPRARLTFRLNRLSSANPEIFYIVHAVPTAGQLPRLSVGGEPFTPFVDQLPGTCRDYFAFDGWAHYATADGHWLWVSRDAPLVTLGSPQPLARRQEPVANPNRLLAMVYNNFWHTNFQADEPGVMEFQFDLVWRPADAPAADLVRLAEALPFEPVVAVNPAAKEDPHLLERLFAP